MTDITYSVWKISQGKGNRHYINYIGENSNGDGLMHPEQLADGNGLGLYGRELLDDLAIAILKFEKANSSSIISRLHDIEE